MTCIATSVKRMIYQKTVGITPHTVNNDILALNELSDQEY